MKEQTKKLILYMIPVVAVLLIAATLIYWQINDMYNGNLVGRRIAVCTDESGLKKIGKDGDIVIMKYNMEMPSVITFSADELYLDEAFRSGRLTIADMCKVAEEKKQEKILKKDVIIYVFRSYKILLVEQSCIIAPIDEKSEELIKQMEMLHFGH